MKNSCNRLVRFLSIQFLTLLAITDHSFSQTYIPFPTSNAYWSERVVYTGSVPGFTELIYTNYINGDTIIDGFQYSKVYKTGVENTYNLNWQLQNTTSYTALIQGLIREDSARNIYIYGTPDDKLLYSFNLILNDTLSQDYYWPLNTGTYVSNIDSVLIGSSYRKRYTLSVDLSPDYIQLIEGIGSSWGLFNFYGAGLPIGGELYCYMDSTNYYILDSTHCQILDVSNLSLQPAFTIYPVPNHGDFTVDIGSPYDGTLTIINSLGQRIFSKEIRPDEKQVEVKNLPSGIYIVSLSDLSKHRNRKIIVH